MSCFHPESDQPSWSCGDIQDMGLAALSMSVADINAVPADEFQDCLGEFGELMGWTTDQRNALWARVKQVCLCDSLN